MFFDDKTILITGGTGSFGNKFTEMVLRDHRPHKVIILSRDEFKQHEMQKRFGDDSRLRFFLGDVRDKERLYRAFHGVDYVIHAAAQKQVPAAEYNPFEAINTNILGAKNVIDASLDNGVDKVVALSTDKAASPVNLYGATKLCSDKLFIAGNSYVGDKGTTFAVVRYGNVVGSRGSVIPFFESIRSTGRVPITDARMTRFWITLDQGVALVMKAFTEMIGGEIFVPKIPSMKVVDLASALCPECEQDIVGIRPGEKIHELMITRDDARHTFDRGDHFVIKPEHLGQGFLQPVPGEKLVDPEFEYSSDTNDLWLGVEDLRAMASAS